MAPFSRAMKPSRLVAMKTLAFISRFIQRLRQIEPIRQEPRLASSELRRQRGADAEDRGEGPDGWADDRDQADRAEDHDADDDHGQIAAQPVTAGELFARARAGHERAD